MSEAFLSSINVGSARPFKHNGKPAESAIWKAPVSGAVRATRCGLEGDAQADRRHHGGVDQAVYAYSLEDYAWWQSELGQALSPGTFGENFTVSGMDFREVGLGERWAVGGAIFEASQPRIPCWKFEHRMGIPGWIERFSRAKRPGIYMRVIQEGALMKGDVVRRERGDGISVYTMFEIRLDEPSRAGEMIHPALGRSWREWADRRG